MQVELNSSAWLRCPHPRPQASIRLFCFPHAGGSASVFQSWSQWLSPAIEVISIQLPGRENRYFEPLFERIEPLTEVLVDAIIPWLDRPFACFGHSMGALLSYEVVRSLRRQGQPVPIRLYAAAFRAPHLSNPVPLLHLLPDADFLRELRQLGGIPDEVWDDHELRQLMLPSLRADLTLCETYRHNAEPPLDCPIVALGGVDDREVQPSHLEAWREHTTGNFRLHILPGDHFFIQTSRQPLLQTLASDLRITLDQIPVGTDSDVSVERIAIIGMSCRFPGATDTDQFWKNLCEGIESISHFAPDDLREEGIDPAILQYPNYVNARGILNNVEMFDAEFFGYSPREAEILDPQQRLFLECAWEALESAGYDPIAYPGLIGTYAGMGMSRYLFNLLSNPQIMSIMGHYQVILANDKDYISTRAAYKLNLRGPAVTVQTACSTSLVALTLACRSLLDYSCDMAIVGGATIEVPQKSGYFYQEGSISSPDGHCRAFDAEAAGTVGGNGVGAVLLKRLSDARADGDTVHAVILGTSMNNDGSVKVGFTAPSVDGEAAAVAMAQAVSGVEPGTIGYIEAHGTGTPLGDPIEIAALNQVFQSKTQKKQFCALGAVKTNIGHLDTASGVAGLIKTALILKHKRIPPTLHFRKANPKIDFANSPFYVNTELVEWQAGDAPRRAGVSSFGIGGTNAHAVLEEAHDIEPVPSMRQYHVLTLAARTPAALDEMTGRLAYHVQKHSDVTASEIAYTLHVGRHAFDQRRVVVCQDLDEAAHLLALPDERSTRASNQHHRQVAFLFPGQGAQYVQMALGVYQTERIFRETVNDCADYLKSRLNLDLRSILFPNAGKIEDADRQLKETWITQPALFVIEYALAQLWMHWGIDPAAMLGHSIGEYSAACLAGVFSLNDALDLVAERGRLMQSMPEGAMVAVALSEPELLPFLEPEVSIAAVNAPLECVASGQIKAIERVENTLTRQGIVFRRLRTRRAFHSLMTEAVLTEFRATIKRLTLKPPQIPFISNLTGGWITPEQATNPEYWTQHIRQPVRFADGVRPLLQKADWIMLEVGPGRTLIGLAQQNDEWLPQQMALPSLKAFNDARADDAALANTLGQLWLSGVDIDWERYHEDEKPRRVPLPTYPFQRQRYWIDIPVEGQAMGERPQDITDWIYVPHWRQAAFPTVSAPSAESSRWLLFTDHISTGVKLVKRLRAEGYNVTEVGIGPQMEQVDEQVYTINPASKADYTALIGELRRANRLPTHIVHLWSLSSPTAEPAGVAYTSALQDRGFYSLLFLAQALGEVTTSQPIQMTVVTDYLHNVNGQEALQPGKATVLGPCYVIPQEFANIRLRTIDLGVSDADDDIIERLLSETADPDEAPLVALRSGTRWVQSFERSHITRADQPRLRLGGVYLITGGLGGLGLALADYLAQTVQAKLILIGRTRLPERSEWVQWLATHGPDDQTAQKIASIQRLEERGAQIMIASADVADPAQLVPLVTEAYARFGGIHGVIHAAGVAGGGIIQLKTREEAERVMAPKVTGTLLLADLLKDTPLDFFIVFSSLAALMGGAGQVDYCAANAFLDSFAHAAHVWQRWPVISINWDRWQEVGMAVKTATPIDLRRQRDESLWRGLRVVEGIQAFERIVSSIEPQFIISTFDIRAMPQNSSAPAAQRQPPEVVTSTLHARPATANGYVPPETDTERSIAGVFETLLGVTPVGNHDSFFELGGHSLLAVQLVSRLRETFSIEMPVRMIFDNPTVAQLAVSVDTLRWTLQTDGGSSEQAAQDFEEGEI